MTEDLQYRLYNTSITPPGDAWPKIVEQLDKETQEKLSLKLQQAVLTPPVNAWDNILDALNENSAQDTKVVPLTRTPRRRAWLAAAAIAAGIIVLGGLYYFNSVQSTAPDTASGNKSVQPQNNSTTPEDNNQPAPQTTTTAQQPGPSLATANTVDQPVPARSSRTVRIRYARVKSYAVTGNTYDNLNTDGAIEQPVPAQPKTRVGPKAYLTIAAPNGQPAKISSKFADAVSYLVADEPADNMMSALKSISWKRKFSNWSNKLMMNPGFIPAATNFLDIVELEELLKEQ